MAYQLIQADVSKPLPLASGSVHCVVTSPPYFGLRDYGIDAQLGLEATPEAYVAAMVGVFREVWRILRDDGVVWLNIGDSYATKPNNNAYHHGGYDGSGLPNWDRQIDVRTKSKYDSLPPGLKPKDRLGIPHRLVFALQQSQYTGRIKDERDRIWLAAMLDAEGCMFIHRRKAGQHNGQGYYRQNDSYGPGVEIANTSLAIIERIHRIVGLGSICSQGPEENGRRKQRLYRWNLRTIESREFIRELYPHLIAKQHQARILYGCPSSGERAEAAHAALIALHRGSNTDVDFPIPPTLLQPGWFFRDEVVWSKLNPMPESVTDRTTKAHEFIFLLSKRERYFYDVEAVKEVTGPYSVKMPDGWDTGPGGHGSFHRNGREQGIRSDEQRTGRNLRSVWSLPTTPYPGAHFATMPPELARRCILAGCPKGGVVFDPFTGSGTTVTVADGLNRHGIGLDLNREYLDLARQRCGRPHAPVRKRDKALPLFDDGEDNDP